jgi:hypothetical protein
MKEKFKIGDNVWISSFWVGDWYDHPGRITAVLPDDDEGRNRYYVETVNTMSVPGSELRLQTNTRNTPTGRSPRKPQA